MHRYRDVNLNWHDGIMIMAVPTYTASILKVVLGLGMVAGTEKDRRFESCKPGFSPLLPWNEV